MIGLTNLPDGAHTLEHPNGPVWLLVRRGRVVRAELWDRHVKRLELWERGHSSFPLRDLHNLLVDQAKGVMPIA